MNENRPRMLIFNQRLDIERIAVDRVYFEWVDSVATEDHYDTSAP